MLDDFLIHVFHKGNTLEAYKVFGAHLETNDHKKGVRFTVYAPNARSVQVVGDFNDWDGQNHYMERYTDGGIWTLFIPGVKEFALYKYRIETQNFATVDRADPYAFYSELRPGTASRVYNIERFRWADKKWLNSRTKNFDKPMNIYEVNIGSWKMKKDFTAEEDGEFYSYEEMIELLIPYLVENSYTHLELMPLTEFPFDGSWGYQATGYFSITSRYGEPKGLMKFINACHKAGIGVIMDFVPAHYVKDGHGLYKFDGGFVYDYPDINRRYTEWDSVYFDVGREEVRSFLMSSVGFLAEYFHIDGIRFDAVSNLIYWKGNKEAGVNDGALEFMKRMNNHMKGYYPGVMLIAEDSSDFNGVTKAPDIGGLGFDYKWDLGWMNDTLKYFSTDPLFRKDHHGKLTFSFMYAFSENYVLPLSHDEVVHGKKSIVDKMPGYQEDKLAHTRALYSYQMAHPGKKLNFMGNEFAHGLEWRFYESLEWHLIEQHEDNKNMQTFVRDLNKMYLDEKSLWEDGGDTFEWIEHENYTENMIAFLRKTRDSKEHIVIVFNFSGTNKIKYRVGIPENKVYNVIINSDDKKYGGKGILKKKKYKPILESWNYREQHIEIDIPANTVVFLKPEKEGGLKRKTSRKVNKEKD